jgi:hypothetical protein
LSRIVRVNVESDHEDERDTIRDFIENRLMIEYGADAVSLHKNTIEVELVAGDDDLEEGDDDLEEGDVR